MQIRTSSRHRSALGRLSPARPGRRHTGHRRLRLEALEARQMLTTFQLIGSSTVVLGIAATETLFDDLPTFIAGETVPEEGELFWNRDVAFVDDDDWSMSVGEPNGVGYDDSGTDFVNFISSSLDLSDTMKRNTSTMFVRIPFNVTAAEKLAIKSLKLRLRHDAGYAIYLNGVKIAGELILPAEEGYDGTGQVHGTPEEFHDLTLLEDPDDSDAFVDAVAELKEGDNLLAIRSLNDSKKSRFTGNALIQFELIGDDEEKLIAKTVNDSFDAIEEIDIVLDVIKNDTINGGLIDRATTVINITQNPGNGTLAKNPDGTVAIDADGNITYTGEPNFIGIDTLKYTLTIGTFDPSEEATVTIKVASPNPIAENDSFRINNGKTESFNISGNDKVGPEDFALDLTSVVFTSGTPNADGTYTIGVDGNPNTDLGKVTINSDGTIDFTSENPGEGSFTYTISDTTPALGPGQDVIIVDETDPTTVFIPTDNSLGLTWTGEIGLAWTGGSEPFNDAAWMPGVLGVGYTREDNDPFDDFIGLDIESEMQQKFSSTAFIRVPFNFNAGDVSTIEALALRMRYDAGFVAYLNGEEVTRANFVGDPTKTSTAADRENDAAIIYQEFGISEHRDKLVQGENILAFYGINESPFDSDFLLQPQLVAIVTGNDQEVILVDEMDPATVFVPPRGTFDDSAWTEGTLGVGYAAAADDADDPYDQFIGLELGDTMQNNSTTIFIRVPFDFAINVTTIQAMTLRMRYDDGFVAYINGVEVTRANVVGDPTNTSTAVQNGDGAAVLYEDFDISAHVDKLVQGDNILSFYGINTNAGSSDFLLQPQLVVTAAEIVGLVSNEATVSLHVNADPKTVPDSAIVGFGLKVVIPVLDNDTDTDNSLGSGEGEVGINPSTLLIVTQPGIGTATLNTVDNIVGGTPDGTITYNSAGATLIQTVTFTYSVEDYEGGKSTETVTVFLDIQPPTGIDDIEVTARDEFVDVDVIKNVADIPGDLAINPLSVVVDSSPEHGTVVVITAFDSAGSINRIRYFPNAGYIGDDTFTYTIADIPGNRSAPATVSISVYEPAIPENDVLTIPTGGTLTFSPSDLSANDFIPTGYQVRIGTGSTLTATTQGGIITFLNGAYSYSPPAGFSGVDSVEYVLYDSATSQPLRPRRDSVSALIEIASGPIAIEGFVYVDLNQDGQHDPNEFPIVDSTITLTSRDDPSLKITTTTDADGYYRFASGENNVGALSEGAYTITQTQPSMYLDFESNPINEYTNITFSFGDNGSSRRYYDFGERTISPAFFTILTDYGAGFVASEQPLNFAAGSLVVPYDSGWNGSFVVQATYEESAGDVTIKLYDSQRTTLATAQSGDGQGELQIEWDATSDQPLVLVVSGNNPSVSVDLPNLGSFVDDTSAPGVVDVLVSSSQWTAAVLEHLKDNGLGDGGYSLWNQTQLPWSNLDQITVRFSEDVDVDSEDLSLWGLSIPDYVAAGKVSEFAYDKDSHTAVWTLSENLDVDRLQIGVDRSVSDIVGNRLMNENFHMATEVYPGSEGFREVLVHYGSTLGDARYSIMYDINGDGVVGLLDAIGARRRGISELPEGSPGPVSSPQAAASVVQNTVATPVSEELSSAGVDAAILEISRRSRRLKTAARHSHMAIYNPADHRRTDRNAAVDSVLTQSRTQTNPRISSSSSRLSYRAHRSMQRPLDDGGEMADEN